MQILRMLHNTHLGQFAIYFLIQKKFQKFWQLFKKIYFCDRAAVPNLFQLRAHFKSQKRLQPTSDPINM